MRFLPAIIITILFIVGCSSRTPDVTPEGELQGGTEAVTGQARQEAEQAFVELESGDVVALPGMTPSPVEADMLAEEVASETEEMATTARSALDYTITPGWFLVDTALVFPGTVSPEEARQQVLQTARAAGLEQALPPTVSFTSLLSDIMDETAGVAYEKATWSTFALSSVTGHLVDEKIMATDLRPLEGGAFSYRMVLEARVVPVRGERDPSLRLDLEVNERLLQAGDELVVRTRANRDGYIYLFDFLSDNTVLLMFPNAMMTDNSVSAGEWLEIPTQQERARGLHYRVAGDPDAPTTNETVYAVFTRQPIADLSGLMSVPEGYVSFSAGDESFTDFQRWLVEIPLSQRVERAVQLHILSEEE